MNPHRIQLSRKAGWTKPENTVVVARPTRWGNPFVPGKDGIPTAKPPCGCSATAPPFRAGASET